VPKYRVRLVREAYVSEQAFVDVEADNGYEAMTKAEAMTDLDFFEYGAGDEDPSEPEAMDAELIPEDA